MRLAYVAIDAEGRRRRGRIDAADPDVAREMLADRGLGVLALNPTRAETDVRASGEELADLASDLARLSRAGAPLAFGARTLAQGRRRPLGEALEQMAGRLESGGSIAEAVSETFGARAEVLAAMAGAGEATGRLADCLDLAARHYAARAEFRRKLTAAAVYPLIVLGLTMASLGVFFLVVLPRIEDALADAPTLPALTSSLLAFGRWLEAWGLTIGTAILVAILACILVPVLRSGAGTLRDRMLLGPLGLGILRDSASSAFSSTFGVLLSSGVALPASLAGGVRAVASPALRGALEAVIPRVRDGERLSAALADVPALPPLVVRLARLGEESGRLSDCMMEAGTLLDRRARARAEMVGSLAPTVFLLIAGLVIGIVVAAVFLGLGAIADFGL